MVAHAARVEAGAPFVLRPVVASDRIGGGYTPDDGRQPVSELCSRAGGLVCVNGDFFNCPTCGQPAGGVVDRGRPLRSFRPDHEQVSILDGQLTTDPIWWVGRLTGVIGNDRFDLTLDSLNRGPMPNGAVLYSPEWGPATPQLEGQLEVVLAAGGPLNPGVTHVVPVGRRPVSGGIPGDGVVVSANGAAADALNWLVDAWASTQGPRQLELHTALSSPVDLSIGGHPVLLRNGERQPPDPNDPMAARRNPRTLLGWTRTGDLLLVTIDGRRSGYSDGATLDEATELLLELGADGAINLDGGGSTTFALRCGTGACVANRPSDGRERPVPLALALVPSAPEAPVAHTAALPAPTPSAPSPAAATEPTTTTTTAPSLPVGATPTTLAVAPVSLAAAPSRVDLAAGVSTPAENPETVPLGLSVLGTVLSLTMWAALAINRRRMKTAQRLQ